MTIENDTKQSPMMMQWHACKKKAGTALLLFRLGDFYEAFYDDAIIAAKELDLTLTKRQDVPMAGLPFHASDPYIDKLIAKGYRVAIAEQMEDPKAVKGLVKREVVRIITPGSLITSNLLSEKTNNFLSCVTQVGDIYGLSILDFTTADFRTMEFENSKLLLDELCGLMPKELLVSEKFRKKQAAFLQELSSHFSFSIHEKEDWHFDHLNACQILLKHFCVHHLDGFGLKGMVAAINASGALLAYIKEDLNLPVDHLKALVKEMTTHYMQLDKATQKHLELTEPLHEAKKDHTLLYLIDQTFTPMGGRLIKKWLMHPLLNVDAIKKRQEGIEEFFLKEEETRILSNHLKEVRDLERLMLRIETGYASPKDMAALRFSLEPIPALLKLLERFSSLLVQQMKIECIDVTPIVTLLRNALVDTPAYRLTDGNVFRAGYHQGLDELRSLQSDSHDWISAYQSRLKEETGIKTLKVGYTKAFGFYIEVSRGQSDRMPSSFQRKQTLTNAERFTTFELKEYEQKMLHREERIAALEYELFSSLRKEIICHSSSILKLAQAIAHIDCLLALSLTAKKQRWARPLVDESDVFEVEGARHPMIEAHLSYETFVPNDIRLNCSNQRMYLITGPNMAGKSTFIRQAALIAILAQMGSFIPATRAHIGIIDKVFSRIGASDDLSRGQSTFMVEMTETANILNNATDRSLVILDEIGRGTSTYDGIAIAWAVAEYLLTCPGHCPKTLFATHYSELTALEKENLGAVNFNVAIHESDNGIVFLRKIVKGGTDKSYGIHVAKLAGLPLKAIQRAKEMLIQLEQSSGKTPQPSPKKPTQEEQLSLFSIFPSKQEIPFLIKELKALNPMELSPLQALEKIITWKEKL